MDIKERALAKHYEWKGKLEVVSRTPVTNSEELSLAYTPGGSGTLSCHPEGLQQIV